MDGDLISYNQNIDISKLTDIIYIFQGGLKQNERYKALNLLPLLSIGTVEVRIKHGSYDPDENIHFMLLYALMMCTAVNKECVCSFYKDKIDKECMYNIYGKLKGNPYFFKETSISEYNDEIKGDVLQCLNHFMDYLKPDESQSDEMRNAYKSVIKFMFERMKELHLHDLKGRFSKKRENSSSNTLNVKGKSRTLKKRGSKKDYK